MARTLTLALLALAVALPVRAVPLPSAGPGAGPRVLLEALSDEDRSAVLAGDRVITFDELRSPNGKGTTYVAVSLGVLAHSPRAVKGLLASPSDYPTWVTLSPTYKALRVDGGRRIACDIGKSSSKRARETLTYDVVLAGPVTTWSLTTRKHALAEGSTLSWEVLPVPGDENRSFVIHRQTGHLSGKGRMSNYLDSDDKQGTNRYWKDANKHARRLHWAMDAALTHPPGRDRKDVYLDRYAADFNGGVPYWAN